MKFSSFFIAIALFATGGIVGACWANLSNSETETLPYPTDEPHIGMTAMDLPDFPASDEMMQFGMDALPFQVRVPDYWSFNEDETSYWVSYHEGLEGTLRFMKVATEKPLTNASPRSTTDSKIHLMCTDRFCDIQSDSFDGTYRVSIDTRALSSDQFEKMHRVLNSIQLD